jgi:hypothetical protein
MFSIKAHLPLAGRLAPLRWRSPACAAVAIALLGAAPAHASRNQATFFEANSELLSASKRAHTIATLQRLGVKALRVELYWREVAPGAFSAHRPKFDATNPASYNWGQYDPLLAEAARLKWQVLLTVTSPVPKWATARRRDYLTSPSDTQFMQFMTAVGRHYGSEVGLYAIYNEPNHPAFLRPQFDARGNPVSPRLYRGLFQAGYAGLRAAGIARPRVLMGETAPFGFDRVNARREGTLHDVAPLAFLRGALCLDSRYHKAASCETLHAYGYSHHAYTTGAGPLYKPSAPGEQDDVTIGVLGRLSSALDRAARARALPAHIPIYLTEYGVQSKPNVLGVSLGQQAEYDALSEKIAWQSARVAAFSQYLLRDDPKGGPPGSSVHGGFIGFQTGLIAHNGRPKPLYYGFPVPLVVSRAGHGYSLWGLVRPASGATRVRVLMQPAHSRHARQLALVRTDSHGYWTLRSPVRGSRWRVSWRSPGGVVYNGPWIGVT